ncbi:MAG: hypothetical protein PHP96_01065 [Candidatus Dojkabacteria bacterium]|jgi:hypothetical protein|nr:hypothetical protein [Candidatus Dojkabacteria bacterium]MDD4560897.1 hypothetical protein [Candidatus Dojkabacteria bacterium]
MNINQFQGIEEEFSQQNTTPEQSSQQDLNQAQFPDIQPFVNQEPESSPMQYVKENTPSNDPVVPFEVAETEETDVKSLREEVETIKSILLALLNKKEIKDFSVLPIDMTKPTFEVSNTSKRSMIFPFGGPAIRYGLDEFKKALEKVISLDANTSILVYQSERIRNNGKTPEPKYMKVTPGQIEVFKTAIANKERANSIPTEQQSGHIPV